MLVSAQVMVATLDRLGWVTALLLIALRAQASVLPVPQRWVPQLRSEVEAAAGGLDGSLSLYVGDVRRGGELEIDADTPTYLSSAIKVVVMLEVLRQVDAKHLSLDQPIVFGPDDVRDGVGPIQRGPPGRRFTVAQLLELMMDRSDNAAADLLMRLVGVRNLDRLVRDHGLSFGPFETLLDERRDIYALLDPRGAKLTPTQIWELGQSRSPQTRAELFSRMIGRSPPFNAADLDGAFKAYYQRHANSASMRQMGRLLGQLARCEGLSSESCSRAHALMRNCRTGTSRIRAGLPGTADWAHKTGTQQRRACDVGILFAGEQHPVVVAACVRDFRSVGEADRLFARIGRALWGAFGDQASQPMREQPAHRSAPQPMSGFRPARFQLFRHISASDALSPFLRSLTLPIGSSIAKHISCSRE